MKKLLVLTVFLAAACGKTPDPLAVPPVTVDPQAPTVVGPTTELEKMGAIKMAPTAPASVSGLTVTASRTNSVGTQRTKKHGMSKAEKSAYATAYANAKRANDLIRSARSEGYAWGPFWYKEAP